MRRAAEPRIHRAAFVGLDVTEADPAQRLDRDEPADRLRTSGNMARSPQWNSIGSAARIEKMIEGEAGRRRDVRHYTDSR